MVVVSVNVGDVMELMIAMITRMKLTVLQRIVPQINLHATTLSVSVLTMPVMVIMIVEMDLMKLQDVFHQRVHQHNLCATTVAVYLAGKRPYYHNATSAVTSQLSLMSSID